MFRLIKAGLIAGCAQLIASLLATLGIFLLQKYEFVVFPPPVRQAGSASPLEAATPFLTWAYFLFAVGFVLTSNLFQSSTATHIRQASLLMDRAKPTQASRILLSLLTVTSLGFAVFIFRAPPDVFLRFANEFGFASVAPLAWSGIIGVGIASSGANAHAALKAFQK